MVFEVPSNSNHSVISPIFPSQPIRVSACTAWISRGSVILHPATLDCPMHWAHGTRVAPQYFFGMTTCTPQGVLDSTHTHKHSNKIYLTFSSLRIPEK